MVAEETKKGLLALSTDLCKESLHLRELLYKNFHHPDVAQVERSTERPPSPRPLDALRDALNDIQQNIEGCRKCVEADILARL